MPRNNAAQHTPQGARIAAHRCIECIRHALCENMAAFRAPRSQCRCLKQRPKGTFIALKRGYG
eukprot:5487858-Pleurochrysis_carterae.AAC.2